jgi:ATP-dependent Clp protease protease subunit
MLNVPGVLWTDANCNTRMIDLTTRLLCDRIIMCTGEINDALAESITSQLLYLEAEDKKKPIKMFINSPGGSVLAGLSIISMMESISCPVHTIISGLAASMGIVIAASGKKGERSVYPLSRIMLHQVSGGYSGTIQDSKINYKEMETLNDMVFEHLSKCCSKPSDEIKNTCQRDSWYSPEEIIKYGLVDKIITSHKTL